VEQLHYPHLGQVIRAIADVLIITGILPNGAIAGHLSANSSDSVTPLSTSSTVTPTAGLKISHINDNDAFGSKQPKSHIANTFIVPINPGRSHIFSDPIFRSHGLALVSIRISQEKYNFAEYASRCYLCQVKVMACL
jgi:hypothetical protein